MTFFMCYKYDSLRGDAPISWPVFFKTYADAKNCAIKEAYISEPKWLDTIDFMLPRCVFYMKIFEVQFGRDIVISHEEGYHNYELYDMCIETVYDPETTASMLIQKKWRRVYHTRLAAAAIIRKHMRKAICNPYTQLCKNRLMREFHELSNDF